MRYFFLLLSMLLLVGCSTNKVKPIVKKQIKQIKIIKCTPLAKNKVPISKSRKDTDINTTIPIQDLVNFPQNVKYYLKNIDDNNKTYKIQQKYEKYYFSIWNRSKPNEKLKDVKWPFLSYKYGKSYGENLQPINRSFFKQMLDDSNFKDYATLNLKAITIKEVNIRAFPTIKPLLRNPKLAGEGFPFDYLQNSTIHANKPILISHYSKNKEWAYVFSSFASGWIKSSEFVVLNKKYTKIWQKAKQIHITKEGVDIYDEKHNFMFKSKIGMMFALIKENKDTYTILTVSKKKSNLAYFIRSKILKNIASKNYLQLNKENLKNIIDEVSKTNYGWGGMYEQRDCSSMLRDLYAPFGIWLPRNSYQQSKVGQVISFENLDSNQKIKLIKEKAVPFQTLLYKKGHIVLYVGTYNDEIIIFHNAWGIKTIKDGYDGRIIIGKPIFSTLKLGKNQRFYDKNSEILKNLKSMNILTH